LWPATTLKREQRIAHRACTDSNSTLKEQIEKLDNMELVEGNEGTCDETDDDKLIDLKITNNRGRFDSVNTDLHTRECISSIVIFTRM
jgi:hypothetical protein